MGLLGESCGAGLDFSSQDNIDYERLCVVVVLAVVTSGYPSVNAVGVGCYRVRVFFFFSSVF